MDKTCYQEFSGRICVSDMPSEAQWQPECQKSYESHRQLKPGLSGGKPVHSPTHSAMAATLKTP